MRGRTSGRSACCSTRWSPGAARSPGRAAATCSRRSSSASPHRWRASSPTHRRSCSASSARRCARIGTQRYQGMKDLLLDLQALRDDLAGRRSSHVEARAPDHGDAQPDACACVHRRHAASQSSAEYVVTGLAGTRLLRRSSRASWQLIAGGAWWAVRHRHSRQRGRPERACPSNPDTSDLRLWLADGCDVVARRTVHRVRVRPDRQLRHLGPTGRRRRSRAGDAIGRAGHATGLVAGWQHPRVPVRARRRRPLPRAGARWRGAATDLVRLLSVLVSGRLRRSCSWMKLELGSSEVDRYGSTPCHRRTAHRARSSRTSSRGGGWSWIAPHPDGRISALGKSPPARSRVLHDRAGRNAVGPVEGVAGFPSSRLHRWKTLCGGGFGGTPRARRCTSRRNRTASTTSGKCVSIRRRSRGCRPSG